MVWVVLGWWCFSSGSRATHNSKIANTIEIDRSTPRDFFEPPPCFIFSHSNRANLTMSADDDFVDFEEDVKVDETKTEEKDVKKYDIIFS